MKDPNDRDCEKSPRSEDVETEPIEFVLEEFDEGSTQESVAPDVASLSPRFWSEALRDLPAIEPDETHAPRVRRDYETTVVSLPDLTSESAPDEWDVDDIDAQKLAPVAPVASPVVTPSEQDEALESENCEECEEAPELQDTRADAIDLPDFEAEERALIPELPDFSQEHDPTIELPDLEPKARLTDVESSVVLPDFSEPQERPYLLTRRRFVRAWRSPAARLIFSAGRRRFWLAAVLFETFAFPPCGVLGWLGLRRVFRFIAQERYGDASRELEKTRRVLLFGAIALAVAALGFVGYVATTYDWTAGKINAPEVKSFDP